MLTIVFSNFASGDILSKYPGPIQKALEYVKKTDFSKMDLGDYPLDGDKMYAKYFEVTSARMEETHPEVHRKYVDVQYWVSGEEIMGFAPYEGKGRICEAREEQDLYLLEHVPNEIFLHVKQGDFMIFFPNDAHRPALQYKGPLTYRKVVVKVSVDLL